MTCVTIFSNHDINKTSLMLKILLKILCRIAFYKVPNSNLSHCANFIFVTTQKNSDENLSQKTFLSPFIPKLVYRWSTTWSPSSVTASP